MDPNNPLRPSELPLESTPVPDDVLVALGHSRAIQRPSRDETFMEIASVLRKRSTCLRGKVGVVIVSAGRIVASGYNGAPPGAPHCFELGCDLLANHHDAGCQRAIHAESNAIAFAARGRGGAEEATMYCTHGACLKCAQLIVSAGIVRFVYGIPYRLPEGLELLNDAGIEVIHHGE